MDLFHRHNWVYSHFCESLHGGEYPRERTCTTCGAREVMVDGWTRLRKHIWKTSDGEKHSLEIQ